MRRTIVSLMCVGAVLAASDVEGVAGQGLPAEVSEWLERDQMQRWAGMLSEGDSIFNSQSCARCHGEGGSDGRFGPNLTDQTWTQGDGSLEAIQRTIFWGVERDELSDATLRFEMNPAGGLNLEFSQYASLAAYVWSLSNGTHLPGR